MTTFRLSLRPALAPTLALALLAGTAPVQAQSDYPRQPIQLIVGYGAGGGTDMCFRALAAHAGKTLGQTLVIDNKPGAGSSLSIAYLTRQAPDGYNVAAFATGALLNQFLNPKSGYDVMRDLQPIAMVAQYQVGLLVRADSPWKSLDDIIKAAKADPKAVSYSTAGVGTPQHLTMVQLGQVAGAQWTHVPYKSGPESILALLRGDVNVLAQTAEWVPYVRDGRLRLLNVFTAERVPGFEQAPTLREAGYQLVAPSILGLVGPKGMPPAVVSKLESAFQQAMKTPEFDKCADQFGLKPDFKNASQFTQYLQSTIKDWEPVIRRLSTD